ncbi:alcohol dehydrogenase catalytic domain-containing protein [Shimia gijangensis]|uniref:alcohol dehydrogenase catalytic domain-containing protein n=1 Tax=Shimia gijangensis TaxID=1470563 RepID=UPI000A59F729|nr:alcohol dehydrogenase catalytic domain-containing protein [Shimia gijangensis]
MIVRVLAAGVNNTDINTRTAWYSKGDAEDADATWSGKPLEFPRIQGADVCGEIVAVGSDIAASRVGERVLIEPCIRFADGIMQTPPWYFGSECDGGFAQYTRVDSRHAYTINSDLTDPVNLKNVLGQINADCGNLHGVAPLKSRYRHLHYGALRRRLEQEPSTPSGLTGRSAAMMAMVE